MSTRSSPGRHVRDSARPAGASRADQIAEIDRDRRSERRLVAQCLLSIIVVVLLVVLGQLLAPW